MSDAVKVD